MAIRVGNRVRKVVGVVLTGTAVPAMPVEKYTDGSYRRPREDECAVYVKWDDGTVGWVHAMFMVRE